MTVERIERICRLSEMDENVMLEQLLLLYDAQPDSSNMALLFQVPES